MSAKVKKNLRKSEAQFRKKLKKLRLRQNNDFLIKKNVYRNDKNLPCALGFINHPKTVSSTRSSVCH